MPRQCGMTAKRLSVSRNVPGSNLARGSSIFLLGKEINGHCYVVKFAENAHLAETLPLSAPSLDWTVRPGPLNCKNNYSVFALGRKLQSRQ